MNNQFYFRYSKTVPKTDGGSLMGANLAYVSIPSLDPTTDTGNLRIVDQSYKMAENNIMFANQVIDFAAGSSIISNDSTNFLLTDEYGNATADPNPSPVNLSVPVRPLWYKHKLIPSPMQSASGSYLVSIYKDGQKISGDHYKLAWSGATAYIYTDLINDLENTYTVVYTQKTDDNATNTEVRKLLSVEPIFTKVTTVPVGKQYKTTIDTTDNRYNIVVPITNKQYSLMPVGTTKIYAKHPVQITSLSDPWYIQIVNGYFKRIQDGNVYEYTIPEYGAQAWAPVGPFKFQVLETPEFLDNNTLRLKQTPLLRAGDTIPAGQERICVYITHSYDRTDSTNNSINEFGTTPSVDEHFFSYDNTPSTKWWRCHVSDIDRNSGIIKIDYIEGPNGERVSSDIDNVIYNTDTLVACYYYIEEEYTYSKKNFNPLVDKSILTGGVSIYARPYKAYASNSAATMYGHIYNTQYSVLEYLIFDNNEKIIGGSAYTGSPQTQTLEDFYTSVETLGVCDDNTVRDNSLLLEIARVFVGPNSTVLDLTDNLVDTRQKGGILLEALPADVISIIETNTNGMYALRNWDSVAYPGYCTVVIKLPSYLLNDNYNETGTILVDEERQQRLIDIREAVKKHMSAGEIPIIRYYDNTSGEILDIATPLDRMDL